MRFRISVNVGDFAPSSQEITDKGLVCRDAVFAIAPQVREYLPAELGLTGWKGKSVRMLTPPDVLFHDDVIGNIDGGDFVDNHPQGNKVTTKNWRLHNIGIASNVRREGDKLLGDLLIRDEDAIKKVQSKRKIALSLGYQMEAEMRPGVTDSGEAYDIVATKMIGDHVALVKIGRGGHDVRIGDSKNEDKSMRKITLANGMTFEVEGENLDAFEQGLNAQNKEYQTLKAAADGEVTIGEKTFKLSDTVAIQAAFDAISQQKVDAEKKATDLEANSIKPEDVEKLATKRAETVTEAKALNPEIDPAGKTVDQIIGETVTAHAGDAAVMAILAGVAVGDANPEKLSTAFNVLVATKQTTKKINANTGDSATAKALKDLNKGNIVNPLDLIKEAKSNMYKQGE